MVVVSNGKEQRTKDEDKNKVCGVGVLGTFKVKLTFGSLRV